MIRNYPRENHSQPLIIPQPRMHPGVYSPVSNPLDLWAGSFLSSKTPRNESSPLISGLLSPNRNPRHSAPTPIRVVWDNNLQGREGHSAVAPESPSLMADTKGIPWTEGKAIRQKQKNSIIQKKRRMNSVAVVVVAVAVFFSRTDGGVRTGHAVIGLLSAEPTPPFSSRIFGFTFSSLGIFSTSLRPVAWIHARKMFKPTSALFSGLLWYAMPLFPESFPASVSHTSKVMG